MAHHHEHDDAHDHEGHDHGPERPVHLFHATAPTCWWSWGYEAVLNRVRMVYGDQVGVHLMVACPYEDIAEYLKGYELDEKALKEWTQEAVELMGVPIFTDTRIADMPPTLMPASLAVIAAQRLEPAKAERFSRALLRRYVVEDQDVTRPAGIRAAALEAGLDAAALAKALEDEEGLRNALEHQGEGQAFPHAPLNFYNLVLADQEGRVVMLENAFDPAKVEDAIDWLGRGKLPKAQPTDIAGYVRSHGPTPLVEVARVFALAPKDAEQRLAGLVKEGKLSTLTLAGAPHWAPKGWKA